MLVAFLRTLILYIVVIAGVRMMGKRQLGELQPSELVVTILISNIATLPIEEIDTPLFFGLLPILSLVTFEVLISFLNLKFRPLRRVFSGRPMVLIQNGVIDQKKLEQLRFSVDDLMAQLRSNGIFAIGEVDFAMVETTGKLSVYQKFPYRPVTPEAMAMPAQPDKDSPPLVIVSDGTVFEENLTLIGRDRGWLNQTLASQKAEAPRVFLMTADKTGSYTLIKKGAAK